MTVYRTKQLMVGVGLTLFLHGCAASSQQATEGTAAGPAPNQFGTPVQSVAADDSEILQAQQSHAIKVEVTCCAPVKKMLRDDTRGLPHEKFLLRLSNGTTVLVAHDTKMAPRVPLQAGDRPVIHGEYIWNKKGGVLHWTHHTDTPNHEGGWIMLNGQKYE